MKHGNFVEKPGRSHLNHVTNVHVPRKKLLTPWSPDMAQGGGHSITLVAFFPEIPNFSLIVRKHQPNPD